MSQEDYITGRHYRAVRPSERGRQVIHHVLGTGLSRRMPRELEKPVVPHSTGAREVAKHPAGWRPATGGSERWNSFPAAITSPKLFKMLV